MEQTTENLIAEIDQLKNEVKMLRAIVQSLMYVITEDQDLESVIDIELDENQSCISRSQNRNYVS